METKKGNMELIMRSKYTGDDFEGLEPGDLVTFVKRVHEKNGGD